MILENTFTVPVHPDRALDLLTDVPRIAPCVPGVALTASHPDRSYDGTASVRLGPVALTFDGKARIEEIDEAAQTVRVAAEGKDRKGRGRANANVVFKISPEGEASRVDVTTDLNLTGSVAQYGRASGLIAEVANQIIKAFVRNLEAELDAEAGPSEPDASPNDIPASDTASTPPPAGETATTAPATPPPRPVDRPAPARPAAELSGFAILRRAIASWLAKLFGRG